MQAHHTTVEAILYHNTHPKFAELGFQTGLIFSSLPMPHHWSSLVPNNLKYQCLCFSTVSACTTRDFSILIVPKCKGSCFPKTAFFYTPCSYSYRKISLGSKMRNEGLCVREDSILYSYNTAAGCQVQPIHRALLCKAQNNVWHNYMYDRAGTRYLSSPSLITNINLPLWQ